MNSDRSFQVLFFGPSRSEGTEMVDEASGNSPPAPFSAERSTGCHRSCAARSDREATWVEQRRTDERRIRTTHLHPPTEGWSVSIDWMPKVYSFPKDPSRSSRNALRACAGGTCVDRPRVHRGPKQRILRTPRREKPRRWWQNGVSGIGLREHLQDNFAFGV